MAPANAPQYANMRAVTASDYLRARDIVAEEIKQYSNVQPNTRRQIAEGLLSKGWLAVHEILPPDPNEQSFDEAVESFKDGHHLTPIARNLPEGELPVVDPDRDRTFSDDHK